MNQPVAIAVVTPTFNRAGYLPRLYESLVAQTCQRFQWIVVDDGSTDDTQEVCARFLAEQRIDMRVIGKPNGGKHTAVNAGVAAADSTLVFIVDSDDYLTPDAMERALDIWSRFGSDRISGISFLRGTSATEPLGQRFPHDFEVTSYIDMRINRGVGGDKAEVYRTDILKAHPFPEFPGEKFLAEAAVWAQIGRFDMIHVNEIVYISRYLPGGLTLGDQSINVRSPNGSVESVRWFLSRDIRMRVRVPMAWRYIAYGRFAGRSIMDLVISSDCPGFVSAQIPFGLLLNFYWKRRFAASLRASRAGG